VSNSLHLLVIVWSASAQKAFFTSLEKIENEDTGTARMIIQRVDKSLTLIAAQPNLGTFTAMTGVRRYAIPNTGHTINYRVAHGELRISRWYRQRQHVLK
jgi:plasmid stabilization system protein ParE